MDIASMLEVEVQEVADSKENVTPSLKPKQSFPCQTFSKEENDFYKLTYGSDVASVRFLKLHCTGCEEHIGSAPAEAHNMHEHPVLRTLLCAKCREFYGDGTFEQGDDATDMFCRWCANGGNLYCCSYCSNTFCSKCIKRNFDPPTIKRIEAEDSWKCFVCDPKDLYPLRSIARALITHIETVTRLLENDRRMSPKDIEEKMHLDETKCCSRKRKRRRRRTLSNSDDDEEEDTNYVPEVERPETPPIKKRKMRRDTVRNVYSNGYMDHAYYNSKRRTKVEPELDPSDLLIPCEQTMIEGDTEIINPNDTDDSAIAQAPAIKGEMKSPQVRTKIVQQQTQQQPQQQQPQQPQQQQTKHIQKIITNNSMAINPVPLANLLKVALSTGAKKIKVTHTPNQKLVAVPMSVVPKAVASSSITFVKPTTHFLVPKSVAKSLQQSAQQQQLRPVAPQQQQQQQESQPSVIDLDSDDEPVILENNNGRNNRSGIIVRNSNIIDETDAAEENVVPEQLQINNDDDVEVEQVVMAEPVTTRTSTTTSRTSRAMSSGSSVDDVTTITIDDVIPLKTQQRDQRFKKMLILQSQEIDNTLGELKTKILKLIQIANAKPQHEADLLNEAAICTKRFNRALRKTLVELSHINDRVVRDYVHWKKKTDKTAMGNLKNDQSVLNNHEKQKEKNNSGNEDKAKDDLTLEMICVRDSASESESEDENDFDSEERTIEASNVPSEFAQILDHLSIFKRKPTGVKAVGESSVFTEDKACQAYDVPWRDYEKCIGYSLLTRSEYDPKTQKELLRPVAMPDENFGKYQEQFVFYLQHIEDFGIETDELKGLPDPNHIPLKDLIDGTSPFIMDMLERLSPVTLSNGCNSPTVLQPPPCPDNPDNPDDVSALPSSIPHEDILDALTPPPIDCHDSEQLSTTTSMGTTDDKTSDDNVAATSKAVEELVKMVTKLSEDLRSEKENEESEIDRETITAVNSILEVSNQLENQPHRVDDEIANICAVTSKDECTILD